MRTAPPIRPAAPTGPPLVGAPRWATPRAGIGAPAPRMDPRISARRVAVRREEGQRRLRRLLWLGGAVASVVVLLGITRTPVLDLDHLEIRGTDDPAAAVALASAGIELGRPLADLDLAAGERALEALPQVAAAELDRRWPGTLEVAVEARRPVASVAVAGGTALVAADGVVVAVAAGPSDLVPVEGSPTLAPGDRFERPELLAVAAALPDHLRVEVASIGPGDGDGSAQLHLADGAVVRLGAADQLADKLVAVATVLRQVDRSCVAVVDVRVPSVPTVTRSATC